MSELKEILHSDRSSSSLWFHCRPEIERRINSLLNLQSDYFQSRVKFYRDLQDFQCRSHRQFDEIFDQRREILEEKGLSSFWSTVLKNISTFDFAVQPRDECCLKYLSDLRCPMSSNGFTLEFHFRPGNPFFAERILRKFYSIRIEFDSSNPYRSCDGAEIDRCESSAIHWYPNRNLTVKKRLKRRRNKRTGEIRRVTIDECCRSFFHFFSPPTIPNDGIDSMNDEDQLRLESDIEFALLLKQRVIPRALLYYTGEMFDDDQDDFHVLC